MDKSENPAAPLFADMTCDVCDRGGVIGVASSSLGPISHAYCEECARKPAEPEWMFGMTYDDTEGNVASWVHRLWTWKDGAYVQWLDWLSERQRRSA